MTSRQKRGSQRAARTAPKKPRVPKDLARARKDLLTAHYRAKQSVGEILLTRAGLDLPFPAPAQLERWYETMLSYEVFAELRRHEHATWTPEKESDDKPTEKSIQ